jgi:hypothetical protein
MVTSVVKFALGGACCLLAYRAMADDMTPRHRGAAVPADAKVARQLNVIRLDYADPANVVNELRAILKSDDLRMAAVKRTNSIVVWAPPRVQQAVADVVSQLDARPPTRNQTNPSGTATVVVRGSPAALTALEALASPPGQLQIAAPTAGNPPAGKQGPEVTVVRIPSNEIAALARALAEVSASHGPQIKTIVVTPSTGSPQEAKRPPAAGRSER